MSSPIHHAQDRDAASPDTPPWLRAAARGRERAAAREPARANAPEAVPGGSPASLAPSPSPDIDAAPARWRLAPAAPGYRGDRAMATLQRQLALHPDQIPQPPLDDEQSLWSVGKRIAAVAGIAALVAWGVTAVPGARLLRNEARPAVHPPAALSVDADTAAARSGPAVQMLLNHGLAEANAMAEPPAEAPSPAAPQATPPQATPSQATPPQAMLPQPAPPQPSAPAAAPQLEPSAPAAAPPPEPAPAAQTPQLGGEEIATLVKRGRDYLSNGDLSSARLLLRRAAEAGSADAALALGASYDPLFLRRAGVVGAAPDPAAARAWYQKAADLGSTAAAAQLAKLAQTSQ
jgi:hypothetical protein